MLNRWAVLLLTVACATSFGQTRVDLGAQSRDVDFSSLPSTRPTSVGTNLPTTCVVGQMFFLTTASAGKNLYICTGINTWSPVGATTIDSGSAITLGNNGTLQLVVGTTSGTVAAG